MTTQSDPVIKGAVTAFREHAQVFGQLLGSRYDEGKPSGWHGFNKDGDEVLEGALIGTDTVKFWRTKDQSAHIIFGFIAIPDFDAIDRSEPKTIERVLEQANVDRVNIDDGVTLHRTYSHQFSHSISESTSWHRHWGVAVEIEIGFTPPYETGGINFDAKIDADFSVDDSASSSEKSGTVDLVSATLDIEGPFKGHIQANRSKEKQQRTITLVPNLDAKVYFSTGQANAEWYPMSTLIEALKGNTPVHTDYTPFAGSTDIRELMEAQPLSPDELQLLNIGRLHQIEVTYTYDDVSAGDISAIRANPTPATSY